MSTTMLASAVPVLDALPLHTPHTGHASRETAWVAFHAEHKSLLGTDVYFHYDLWSCRSFDPPMKGRVTGYRFEVFSWLGAYYIKSFVTVAFTDEDGEIEEAGVEGPIHAWLAADTPPDVDRWCCPFTGRVAPLERWDAASAPDLDLPPAY